MKYQPRPINTAGIVVPPDLVALTERLAENAHDLWARQRVAEGWRYGPERNDRSKTNPCLVPYQNLPESEKNYDREAVGGTLKAVLALGYVISKPRRRQ